ncbi:LacI family DNA-binding transcriptional regulator [Paenibacillus cisolokensis]|uniref:LacI family DNA-binding transcriptional regulator n=1 Tax=Paenibacillus cisolokensis TaxID=1658519 RepID=UPI003D2CE0ED
MEDIAKLAGVSKSAVSLALNGKPGIGPENRERILQIERESGYIHKAKAAPDESANRSLKFLAFVNSGNVLREYYEQPLFRSCRRLRQYFGIGHRHAGADDRPCRVGGMARLAVELVIRSIEEGDPVATKIAVDTRLIERHSSRRLGEPAIAAYRS